MKKIAKLKLSKQTVRILGGDEMRQVNGAMPPQPWISMCPSQRKDSLCQCDTWHDCGPDDASARFACAG